MYAIKVWLTKPKTPVQEDKNWYLMKDMEHQTVHVYTRKEKAQKTVDYLQEQNPKMQIEITEDIPVAALARALKKKQDDGQDNNKKEEPLSETITPTAS